MSIQLIPTYDESSSGEGWQGSEPAIAERPSATDLPVAAVALECDLRHDRERVERVLSQRIEFVHSPSFRSPAGIDEFQAPGADCDDRDMTATSQNASPKPPSGTPPYLAALYAIPLLTHEQEQHLFRKMNYWKYSASMYCSELNPVAPNAELLDQIEMLLTAASRVRNQIVRANLRLVVSIAKTLVDRASSFEELVSDGNVPLMRAVELFDFERGTRFSTYATWAVRNSLYRSTNRRRTRRSRFTTSAEPLFNGASDPRHSITAQESYHRELRREIGQMLLTLDDRDRLIVSYRFGLDSEGRPRRFREIAEMLNISTERVRQLLARSLRGLRLSADGDLLVPDAMQRNAC